jgi:hypothetical protein
MSSENDDLIIKNFEDIGPLKEISCETISGKVFRFENCKNNNLISEDSLIRTLSVINNKIFAIISAYRQEFTKEENIIRNRKLRDILNSKQMGVHQLVGHWLEAPKGKVWNKVPSNELKDVIERSYLVAKPDSMTNKEFTDLIISCLTIENETQDAALIHFVLDDTNMPNQDDKYYCIDSDGILSKVGDKLTIGQIGKVYSQHVKKTSLPFKFEGMEIPSSISGRYMFSENNIYW